MADGGVVTERAQTSAPLKPPLYEPPTPRFEQYADAEKRYFGWNGDEYKLMKYGSLTGMLQNEKTWPLSERGWNAAWAYLIENHAQLAAAIAARYAADLASTAAAKKTAADSVAREKARWQARTLIVSGETPGTKICPMCAEEVKLAAVICRFCGYTFETADGAPPSDLGATSQPRPAGPTAPQSFAASSPSLGQASGTAITAFICSIIGLWFVGLPLGIFARNEIDNSAGRVTGRGFATAAIVLGIIGIFATIIVIIVFVSAANNMQSTLNSY
jgi:Domain of unknown function (DUF4190)/Uncharacterised protein family UPF0547